jgi:nucleotide-binding universal stress UspA family protein
MLRRETLAVSENQLKRLLIVLCALTVVLTLVSAINAFEPLRAGFIWTVEHVYAAFNWAVHGAWDWAVANDLPQGWAILIGVIIGLGVIAWQLRIGFRNLMLSHANQAELDRQASREEALLDREAQEYQAELQAQAQEALQRKEVIVFSAALRGELMAAAYQISSRLIWARALSA